MLGAVLVEVKQLLLPVCIQQPTLWRVMSNEQPITNDSIEVCLDEISGGGIDYYVVMVNGKPYETLWLRKRPRLTFAQMRDVASYYREALTDYIKS
jgi:hypothetical protein